MIVFAAGPPPIVVALAVCLLLGGALTVASLGLSNQIDDGARPDAPRIQPTRKTAASIGRGRRGDRTVIGVAVGFMSLLATRWVMLSLLIAILVVSWRRLLHDDRSEVERGRVEGIAKWLEDLRDTLRGSAYGAEEALQQVATRSPAAISDELHHFAAQLRQGRRTEDALADLGDELAHPTADAAVAAIRLVVGGSAGAGRLFGTVQALASAARAEVAARERIDRTRAIYQASMKRLVVIGALLVGYLRFAAGSLLAPYDTAVGQVVLLVPLAMWVGCVLWLRSLCRYGAPELRRVAGYTVITR